MEYVVTPNTRRRNTNASTPGVSFSSSENTTSVKKNNNKNVTQHSRAFIVEGKTNEHWDPMTDLDVSKVLFHEHVPVAIRGKEEEEHYSETTNEEDVEEERVEICSVRVMLGPTGNTQTSSKSRVLRVHVQSEKNPFFSHSMEVNEEEFNFRLKREQNIRVDFNQFPTHFIDLLRECLDGMAEDDIGDKDGNGEEEEEEEDTAADENVLLFRRTTRNSSRKSQKVNKSTDGKKNAFFAVLTVPEEKKMKRTTDPSEAGREDGGSSVTNNFSLFTIYETNKFNTVGRLSLRFARASDEQLKKLLAGRLFDANEDRNMYQKIAEELRESIADAEKEVKIAREQERLAKMQYASETAANRTELENERAQLHTKNEALDKQVRDLRDELFLRTQTQTEIEMRNRVLEEELQSLRDEVAESRVQLRNADVKLRDKDQEHMARLHRVEWLESQLNDKDEVNALVKRRLEQAEAHIQSLDKSWNQSREQTEKAESIAIEYANEIKKGNSVIERLANELKAVKSKSKLRSTVVLQQEQLLEEQKLRLDKALDAKRQTEEEKDILLEETERVKLKLSEKDRRISELEDEKASDGKMISWLNAQINDAQLRRSAQSDLEKFAF